MILILYFQGANNQNSMQTNQTGFQNNRNQPIDGITLQQILLRLNMKSIQQLLSLDSLNIHKMAHRQKMHPQQVQFLLEKLHDIIMNTQLLNNRRQCSQNNKKLIQISKILNDTDFCIQEGQLIEILGRGNSGKTFLMAEIMKQAIHNNIKPILLCNGNNQAVYHKKLPQDSFMSFAFNNLCELSMLIHSLGNHIIKVKQQKFIIFIDCLSQVQLQEENLQFDISEKFRRLVSTFINRTHSTILYSYRINNSLFRTMYKKDHYRPKCRNSKQWDGWSQKSIFIDHLISKKDLRVIVRYNFPKSLDNKLHEMSL